jgi:glyoxylase-like metal-dependent hydrolase (beta-lactamase superfamily II)
MSISLKTGGEEAIFTGDIAHNAVQIFRPEWVSVFCAEAEQSRVSRRWLLDYAVSRNAVLFTAHFPEAPPALSRAATTASPGSTCS